MTQHEVQCTDFGTSRPEVAGVGEGTPQQAIFEFSRKGKSQKCASVNTLALLAGLMFAHFTSLLMYKFI